MASTYEQLLKYMTAIKKLEQEKFTLKQTISKLKWDYNHMGQRKNFTKKTYDAGGYGEVILAGLGLGISLGVITFIVLVFVIGCVEIVSCTSMPGDVTFTLIMSVGVAVIRFLYVFIRGAKEIKKTNDINKYEEKQYAFNVEKDEQRVRNELAAQPKLKADIDILETTLSKVNSTLSQLYSLGILPSKYYWDLVAVTEIHEYLKDGQTYTLRRSGSDEGAIKIYEDRLQSKQIIGLLNDVLDSLDEIKANQYSLYSAIQESNNRIASLTQSVTSSMARLQQSVDVASYNSAVTAQCAAEMRDLQYYKMLLS